ncbi:MAG: hypothetical protein M5U28_26580 [Sandaracinaceae bacterium]|nr:hypothetical protein [Sandaracinaceae bacterium]
MELRGAGDVLGAEQSGTVAAVGFDLFLHAAGSGGGAPRRARRARGRSRARARRRALPPGRLHRGRGPAPLLLQAPGFMAADEQEVVDLASEMEDRFGPAPHAAQQLVRAMRLKPSLRELRVLGYEASAQR